MRASSSAARPTRTWPPVTPEPFRVGLLGHGTVGAAFARLLDQRADAIAPVTGLRPELAGILTRTRGDFDALLASSDLIVELIGGSDPPPGHLPRAKGARRPVL